MEQKLKEKDYREKKKKKKETGNIVFTPEPRRHHGESRDFTD